MDEQTAVLQYRMAAEPAFQGYIETTLDALLIFEACQRGMCPRVTRRLHERERRQIGSGSVYVFDEREAGIKRWTDGRVWSPSRILQNFLVYRELDKRATPTGQGPESGPPAFDDASGQQQQATPSGMPGSANSPHDSRRSTSDVPGTPDGLSLDRNRERALVGSLTSSYRFRADGLVKKTISVSGLHMISYYKIDDVLQGRLRTPTSHPELHALDISPGFLVNQNFRVTPQIEIGPDGRPRYRGEGEEGLPGSTGPPGPLHPPPPPGSAMAYAYAPGPSDKPSRPPSDDSGNSHAGSPASPHLSLGGPSGPGMGLSEASPSRTSYGRGQSSAATSGPGRSALGMSSQGARFDPYGRPSTGSGPSAPPAPYYPPSGSNNVTNPNNTSGYAGYPMGDQIPVAMPGQRAPAPPASAWAGRHPPANGAPYYGPSPPNSATEARSFDTMQQSMPGYPPYRVGSSGPHYPYPDEASNSYRSASVPPNAPQPGVAPAEGTATNVILPPEPRPSSASYHHVRVSDEAAPAYLAGGAPPGRGYLPSSRRQSTSSTTPGLGPTRTHHDGTNSVAPLRGPSPYHYGGGVGGASGSPAMASFRPPSASSNSAYSSLHDNVRGGVSSGRSGGVSASGSPLLSPCEVHQNLPPNLIAGAMMGPLQSTISRHKDDGGGLPPTHNISRIGGGPHGSLPMPQGMGSSSGSSNNNASVGQVRKTSTPWQPSAPTWLPFKEEE